MSKKNGTPPPKTVDDYMESLPGPERELLIQVRKAIKEAAPEAEEIISYRIPTYKLNGALVHFVANKDYCSLIVVSPTITELFKAELKDFHISGRTIHFTPDKPIPSALLQRIVKTRVQENKKKASKK